MVDSPVMKYIIDKVDYSILPEPLPIMHSCEVFDCESIIEDVQLKPTMCPVFEEELLYFFYGKPSYQVGEKEKQNRTDDLCCPVCFIIDIDRIDIYRVFPFDSGAFKHGMYSQFIHKHMKIDKFEIDNKINSIRAYVSVVFSNNWNYINGITVEKQAENTYTNALLRMLSANGGFNIDERANTIEVICRNPVDISKDVRGIVLPEGLLRKKGISNFILNNKIEYKTYEVRNMTSPIRYNEIVFQLSMEFI